MRAPGSTTVFSVSFAAPGLATIAASVVSERGASGPSLSPVPSESPPPTNRPLPRAFLADTGTGRTTTTRPVPAEA
jgi:hypothetical protein